MQSLLEVSLKRQVINNNTNAFDVNGMIDPTFKNIGTENVMIDNEIVLPGQYYVIPTYGAVLRNSYVSINFSGNDKNVLLKYKTQI